MVVCLFCSSCLGGFDLLTSKGSWIAVVFCLHGLYLGLDPIGGLNPDVDLGSLDLSRRRYDFGCLLLGLPEVYTTEVWMFGEVLYPLPVFGVLEL